MRMLITFITLASAGEAAAGCARVTSPDMTLRVYPSIKAQVVARLQAGDLVDTDLNEYCQWDAFQTRKVCDHEGDWIKVERVWRKDNVLEIAGWAGKKHLRSLSLPAVDASKLTKKEEAEAGCARE
jgi:hypothetical protein